MLQQMEEAEEDEWRNTTRVAMKWGEN